MFGLPGEVAACLFDMDGVVTQTAVVHAAAWKEMFDDFLRQHAESTGTEFVPFDAHAEYDAYVDGKPRLDGTRSFLASRGIDLPEGTPDDPPGTPTIYGLSNRKNDLVLAKLAAGGVQVYEGSISYIRRCGARGYPPRSCRPARIPPQVLDSAGIAGLFDVRVDGVIAKERGLPASRRPTRSWPRPRRSRYRPAARRCSRTRWPASRRAGRAISRSWSGWTGSARRSN